MKNQNRPLLAATLTPEHMPYLRYPLLASPKFDGIRVRVDPILGAVSRMHKSLPNRYLQMVIKEHPEWAYFDGEITIGDPTDQKCFNTTQSGLMTEGGTPDFRYWVFDCWKHPDQPFASRFKNMVDEIPCSPRLVFLQQHLIPDQEALEYREQFWLAAGYEGMMLRSLDGPYKFGRSTLNEQILMKLKRFEDDEAVIVGIEQLEHNNNTATQDKLGYTKRTSHKANKVATEMAGNLIVKSDQFGQFSIGSGFDQSMRKQLWDQREFYVGKVITFKYQKCGMKDHPRFPIFKGFRDD